jgi:hypothetical protein
MNLYDKPLYEYISFNIRVNFCVHELLINLSNRDRIDFLRADLTSGLAHLTALGEQDKQKRFDLCISKERY